MNVVYSDTNRGIIKEIFANGVLVPFYENAGPSLYIKNDNINTPLPLSRVGEEYICETNGVLFYLKHRQTEEMLEISVRVKNNTDVDFAPEALGLKLGINSYMEKYPDWNGRFFPTLLRSEKTHFYGYFQSPEEKICAVVSREPVSAWELDYNTTSSDVDDSMDFGHRIYTGNLLLLCRGPLPKRHPQNLDRVGACEEKEWKIYYIPRKNTDNLFEYISKKFSLPMLDFKELTIEKGKTFHPVIYSEKSFSSKLISQSGEEFEIDTPLTNSGLYEFILEDREGKIASSTLFVRESFEFYLKAAAKNAVMKPQKATTHTEGFYGWFSAFLAKKHYPNKERDELSMANFREVAPLMFDFERGVPTIIPSRVQNLALFISVLVDIFESDKEECREYIDYADLFAEELIKRQTPDGAYRKNKTHYTSVIYIAKAMLELANAEKELAEQFPKYKARYEKHYNSAKLAVDNLCLLRECIETEGEHTLEDGMLTCSALQIGYFALGLPEAERGKYIESAEHIMSIHKCLEQRLVPDARMRGATLRFWEAQYDVLYRANMLNSPHGWTSWKNYATYYLYLLTGKREYLIDTINTMGACLSCVDENENLRWAFIADPYINCKVFVPDETKPIRDGYKSASHLKTTAYRGKYQQRIFGECYVDMISSWYRQGAQLLTGGYAHCPLIYDDRIESVDNQGGCCDNDVHEHFKCLEETLLKKAFVIYKNDELECFFCGGELKDGVLYIEPSEKIEFLHVNADKPLKIKVYKKTYQTAAPLEMISL